MRGALRGGISEESGEKVRRHFSKSGVGGPPTLSVITEPNCDSKLDRSNTPPGGLIYQGAYTPFGGTFQNSGAIPSTNLDYDEERVESGKPVADSIRFWHNGLTFEASDEDFKIKAGERSIAPQLTGYTPPPAEEVSTPCPDITPIMLPRLDTLPAGYRVLLRVARTEDLKAFHLYQRIPDFAKDVMNRPECSGWWRRDSSRALGFWGERRSRKG
jgi:hypothetical protein